MKLLIADTGPVLHLEEADLSGLLTRLGEVHITPVVLSELQRRAGWTRPAWLHVDQPSSAALSKAKEWTNSHLLHVGEAESLAHAKEIQPIIFSPTTTLPALQRKRKVSRSAAPWV